VIRSNTPTGLVVFSDTAYEMLPPGAPGTELKPLLRFFTPRPGSTQTDPIFLENPWTDAFRGGTRISSGLELARQVLRDDHVRNGSVLLISDLDSASSDVTLLTQSLLKYKEEHLPLRLMALDPQAANKFFFERMLGRGAFDDRLTATGKVLVRQQRVLSTAVPHGLVALALLLLAALAANELYGARLPLPRRAT
jgi:hypothetical protein